MAEDKCIFCIDVKTEPITIPCGHSFCKVCFNSYKIIGRGTTCPLCRSPFVSNIDQDFETEERYFEGTIPLIEQDFETEESYFEGTIPLIETTVEFQPAMSVNFVESYYQEYEDGNFTNSQGLIPTLSEVDSLNPFDEDSDVGMMILENDQMEFDETDEDIEMESYHEEIEIEIELSNHNNDDNDDYSDEMF